MGAFRKQNGFIGTDIAISIVVLFMFATIIASLLYKVNSSSKQIELQSDATYMAVKEIETIKGYGISNYTNCFTTSTTDVKGNSINQEVDAGNGFHKKIIVEDYQETHSSATKNKVKKITVQISYKYKKQTQTVQIATVVY